MTLTIDSDCHASRRSAADAVRRRHSAARLGGAAPRPEHPATRGRPGRSSRPRGRAERRAGAMRPGDNMGRSSARQSVHTTMSLLSQFCARRPRARHVRRRRPSRAVRRGAVRPATSPTALQQKYDTIRDFSADFSQTYEGGCCAASARSAARCIVKKPGKMRWDYKASGGEGVRLGRRRLYPVLAADNQVIVSDAPGRRSAGRALPRRQRESHPRLQRLVRPGRGARRVDAAPRAQTAAAEYDWLEITADRDTLQLAASSSPRSRAADRPSASRTSRRTPDWPIRRSSSPSPRARRSPMPCKH